MNEPEQDGLRDVKYTLGTHPSPDPSRPSPFLIFEDGAEDN
ncbi:MAG: hypothetical protein R3300_22270 [Candidatus Promineifilaceae bacterium]|nr:hypothetical protein [Candidatus Promineifilaceae bacterium]